MKRVFISYSRQDREFARRLAKSLAEVGADVWIDYEDIPAGKKWSTAIQQGLDSSDGLLVLVSPDAMSSSNVEDEWQYFLDGGKPVIPILYKPAKFHFQLHRLQYINFSNQRFGDAFAKLLDELSAQGIPIQVETVEDTWVFDVKRSKPPKKEVEYLEESKRATFHNIKVKKPILQKPSQEEPQTTPPFLMIGIGLILLAIVVIAGLFAASYFKAPTSPQANLRDFAEQPLSVYFYNEDFEVYEEANGDTFEYFDSLYILERFEEEGREWYQLYDVDNDEVGYQTADSIPLDAFLLQIVPVAKDIPNNEIQLYTAPSLSASSYPMQVDDSILVYGFRYDDSEQLWYYIFVEMDGDDYMGWLAVPSDNFALVGDSPALAYTTAATPSYWSETFEEEVFTIPAGELLMVVGQTDNRYLVALIHDETWVLLWVDGSTLDINAATRQFIEEK